MVNAVLLFVAAGGLLGAFVLGLPLGVIALAGVCSVVAGALMAP